MFKIPIRTTHNDIFLHLDEVNNLETMGLLYCTVALYRHYAILSNFLVEMLCFF